MAVQGLGIGDVGKDLGLFRVESDGYDVKRVLVGIRHGVLYGKLRGKDEFFVVGKLEPQFAPEAVLKVLGKNPR